MESTKEKKCPKCGSEDIINAGYCENIGGTPSPDGLYEAPTIPVYECKKCGNNF